MYWTVPKLWNGGTAYIIGGGPSVKNVDLSKLENQKVIAINNAFKVAPWAPFLYFMDCKWYTWNRDDVVKYEGIKVTTCVHLRNHKGIKFIEHGYRDVLDHRPEYINRGNNSGVGAMCLAWKLGATRIVLLGFDMQRVDGKFNYHDEHKLAGNPTIYRDLFIPNIALFGGLLALEGVEIINATPGSRLEAFPIVAPETVYP